MKSKKKTLKVSKRAMLKEHKALVRILDTGSRKEQKREAKKQKKEMKEYK